MSILQKIKYAFRFTTAIGMAEAIILGGFTGLIVPFAIIGFKVAISSHNSEETILLTGEQVEVVIAGSCVDSIKIDGITYSVTNGKVKREVK